MVFTNIVGEGVPGQMAPGPTNIVSEPAPGAVVAARADQPAPNVRRRTTTVMLIDDPGIPRDGLCALLESDSALEVINDIFNRADPDSVRVRCVEHLTEHNRPYYLIGG